MRNFHSIFTFFCVQQQIETAGTHFRQLSHNDVFRDTSHRIYFSVSGCVHQHINSFLEGTSHQSASILSVDTVTSNGHEMSFGCHYVTQQGKMSIVYVQAVELEHSIHFLFHRFSYGFNAQHTEDFANVVTECSNWIYIAFAQYFHHRRSVSFQQPFTDSLELSRFRYYNSLFAVRLWQVHIHFSNCFNALQSHVRKHISFDASQEHIVVHFIDRVFVLIVLEFVVFVIHDSDAKHQFVCVVVVKYAIQIVSKTGINLFGNLFHCQFLVCHSLAIQFDSQKPWRNFRWIKVGHFVVNVDKLLILGNHSSEKRKNFLVCFHENK